MKDLKDRDHVTIQSWMRTDLNLKGNDLIIYAIIHNFSKDGKSEFYGGLQYLADWCGCTKQGVLKNLKNLVESELIIKTESEKNGVKYCSYKVNTVKLSLTPLNSVERPIKHSLTNNIYNNTKNKKNSVSINTNTKPGLIKSKSRYDVYQTLILSFTKDIQVQKALQDFLNLQLEIYKEKGKSYYSNIFKSRLNKLKDEFNEKDWLKVIRYAVEHGYQNFYAIPEYDTPKKSKRYDEDVSSEQYTEEEQKEIKKWHKELKKNGKQVKF